MTDANQGANMTGVAPKAGKTDDVHRYGDVSVRIRGEGKGPLVVLLPSQARDSDDYDVVAAGLANAGYRVLRPQPRGIGESRGPLSSITLQDLARDVAEAIRVQQNGPAVILGHAYGHYVARMTAVAFPDVVKGIVVAAAAAKSYPPELSLAVTCAGDVTRPDAERLEALRRVRRTRERGADPQCQPRADSRTAERRDRCRHRLDADHWTLKNTAQEHPKEGTCEPGLICC
jgi:pimeloyl-ACP methyl ester carboxylesterase